VEDSAARQVPLHALLDPSGWRPRVLRLWRVRGPVTGSAWCGLTCSQRGIRRLDMAQTLRAVRRPVTGGPGSGTL